jgi:phytol kinase
VSGLGAFGLATALLVGMIALLELAVRRTALAAETARRIAHVVACLYGLFSHSVLPLGLFVAACSVFVLALAASRRLSVLRAVHTTRRRSLGEVYLPVGIIIAALAAVPARDDDRVFLATILVLALADVAAGLTGDVLRSVSKTWRGSFAFLVVALVVTLSCGFPPVLCGVVAIAATATERISSRGTDNLTVPLVTGLLLALVPL